jgi:hypothetical protein
VISFGNLVFWGLRIYSRMEVPVSLLVPPEGRRSGCRSRRRCGVAPRAASRLCGHGGDGDCCLVVIRRPAHRKRGHYTIARMNRIVSWRGRAEQSGETKLSSLGDQDFAALLDPSKFIASATFVFTTGKFLSGGPGRGVISVVTAFDDVQSATLLMDHPRRVSPLC